MEPEVIDIDDVPVSSDQSRSKRKCKRKEVSVHEIIDVDMDEDPNDVVFIQGEAKSTKKMKGAIGISLGSGSSVQYDSKKVMSNTKAKLENLRRYGNDEGMRKKVKVDRTIKKFKARLINQGFKQMSWIDYFDTYDSVTRISIIKLLIATASIHNLIIHHMDAKITFLNAELDEDVYMNQPQGFHHA
nr:zinc finger, CCHC-type [Tanacetum cinerariifolium]